MRSILASVRGSAAVESVVLLATVGIGVALAIVALGIPLLRAYRFAQTVLSLPLG